jgi:hypothetical protein
MRGWDSDELRKIAEADDLHVSPFREDGSTYGTPTWRQKAGRILAAGFSKEVIFEPVEGSILDSIDEAYRTKYRGNRYLEPMIGARARAATIKIAPRDVTIRSPETRQAQRHASQEKT